MDRDPTTTAAPPRDHLAADYLHNAEAPRISTDLFVFQRLEQLYPGRHIAIVPEASCNLLAFAAAGHASATPAPDANGTRAGAPLQWLAYVPPASRLDGDADAGQVAARVVFGKYAYSWRGRGFVVYLVDGRDGDGYYPNVRNFYIVAPSGGGAAVAATEALVLAVGRWGAALHGEIWVFDQGYWQKDAALWRSMQKARWDDVILDPEMKKAIIGDVDRFFGGRDTYRRLRVPWKRGIIFHGPPGNGKTISIKATMHMLYERKDPVPTLYVKTLFSFSGPEYSLNQIFSLARATAPCYLVFEDLDSIVSDNVRSFFLNQVDGLNANDGILMVGSTNHLELLDPGISKRPSRFDRKYLFPNPNFEERTLYAEFWRKKLLGGEALDGDGLSDAPDEIEFPKEMCEAVAGITDGFSFAYIQEAFVASLMMIVGDEEEKSEAIARNFGFVMVEEVGEEDKKDGDKGLEGVVLWREFKKQVKLLREEMGDSEEIAV